MHQCTPVPAGSCSSGTALQYSLATTPERVALLEWLINLNLPVAALHEPNSAMQKFSRTSHHDFHGFGQPMIHLTQLICSPVLQPFTSLPFIPRPRKQGGAPFGCRVDCANSNCCVKSHAQCYQETLENPKTSEVVRKRLKSAPLPPFLLQDCSFHSSNFFSPSSSNIHRNSSWHIICNLSFHRLGTVCYCFSPIRGGLELLRDSLDMPTLPGIPRTKLPVII